MKSNEKYIKTNCLNKAEKGYTNLNDLDYKTLNSYSKIFQDPDSCYCRMYSSLLPHFLIYKVKSENKDLKFIRTNYIDTYIVPTVVLEKADAFISYGIWSESFFENKIADLYQKDTFSYDCGVSYEEAVREIENVSPYFHFESQCIGTDKFILTKHNQISSQKIHSFGEKLKELGLLNKKVYLKMDIAGAEKEVIPDIVKFSDNITGISVVLRFERIQDYEKIQKFFKLLEEKFVLVYRNNIIYDCFSNCDCDHMGDVLSTVVCLNYINKNLVDKKYLPFDQNCSDSEKYIPLANERYIPEFKISPTVILNEKINNFIKNFR